LLKGLGWSLLQNAAQSLPQGKGNIFLTVTKGNDEWVYVSVQDTGCGIPAENLSRIFEPYFTTKPVGREPAWA
jgi:signal transduction histidine kinase